MFCIIECIEKNSYVFDIILKSWIINETTKEFKWPGSLNHQSSLKQMKSASANWKTYKFNRILENDIGYTF